MSSYYFNDSFRFLEKDYQVIFYDQRGSGFSQIKPDLKYYHFDELVKELEAVRKEVLMEDKITVIGHSFGGLLALRYAIDYAKHIDKMILISSLPAKAPGRRKTIDFRSLLNLLPPEMANKVATQGGYLLLRGTFYDKKNYNKLRLGYTSYATSEAVSESFTGYDYSRELGQSSVKTLIIYGEADIFSEEVPKALHQLIHDSRLVKFNKSGHWVFLEEPDRCRKDWLRQRPCAAARCGW